MKILAIITLLAAAIPTPAAEPFEKTLEGAALEYGKRIDTAARELAETRAQIGRERAPLAARLRDVEDRLIAVETELTRQQTGSAQAENLRGRRQRENEGMTKTFSYLGNVAQESLKAWESGLLPGESALFAGKLEALRARLEQPTAAANPEAAWNWSMRCWGGRGAAWADIWSPAER